MSLLDVIRIAEPCTEAWSSMTGDERARHCRTCDKTVFDLSAMKRAEAEALLAEQGSNLCGRYFQRTDGTIVMADCLVRPKHRRLATVGAVAVAVAALVGVGMHESSPESIALDDVALPDDTEVRLPARVMETAPEIDEKLELERAVEELRKALQDRQDGVRGEMLSGDVSFYSAEELRSQQR